MGGVLRRVQVSGWKGERGMPGCVTVAILSTACVLTLSPVSHWGTNSSYWHSAELPLPLFTRIYPSDQSAHSLSPSILAIFLLYPLSVISVSQSHLCHCHLFSLNKTVSDSPLSLLPLSLSVEYSYGLFAWMRGSHYFKCNNWALSREPTFARNHCSPSYSQYLQGEGATLCTFMHLYTYSRFLL